MTPEKDSLDDDWLLPQFNNPNLFGNDSVNECDLFMLLRDFSYKEQIEYMRMSSENIHKLEMSMDRIAAKRGPDDRMTIHLLSSKERLSKLKVLMERRKSYIHKLTPVTED